MPHNTIKRTEKGDMMGKTLFILQGKCLHGKFMEWGIREYVEAYFDPEKVELPRLDDPKRLRLRKTHEYNSLKYE